MVEDAHRYEREPIVKAQLIRFFVTAFGGAWLAWLPIILGKEGLSLLPVSVPSSLVFIGTFTGPMLAAFLFSDRTERRDLIRQMFRIRMRPRCYAAALLLAPIIIFAVTLAFSDEQISVSRWSLYASYLVPMLVFGSIAGPWGEEPGWRGFALPRLVACYGFVRASLLLGVIWALWHLPIALFVPAYNGGVPAGTFFPALVVTVCALSFFMTWLYYSSGCSVLATIIAHAAWNAAIGAQNQLTVFPDRRLSLISAAVLLAIIALTASRGLSRWYSSGSKRSAETEPNDVPNTSRPE